MLELKYGGFPSGSVVKNLPAMQETQVPSLGQQNPWRRKWQLTPGFLPGKSHGQKSLAGYSPWGHKESDTTEQLTQQQINPALHSARSQFLTLKRFLSYHDY